MLWIMILAGALLAAAALGVGAAAGWTLHRRKVRRGGIRDPTPEEAAKTREEERRIQEETAAFHRIANYSAADAYGLND